MLQNLQEMLKDIPHSSSLRREIIGKLGKEIDNRIVSTLLGVSLRTVERAVEDNTKKIEKMIHTKMKKHQKRRVSQERFDEVEMFWRRSCRESSTKVMKLVSKSDIFIPVHWQEKTDMDLYSQYNVETQDPVSFSTFIKHRPRNVKKIPGNCCRSSSR